MDTVDIDTTVKSIKVVDLTLRPRSTKQLKLKKKKGRKVLVQTKLPGLFCSSLGERPRRYPSRQAGKGIAKKVKV